MPNISLKVRNMPESPIRKLTPFAEAAVMKGIKIYHLNIGQPDIKTPEVALSAVRNYNTSVIEYSHSAGMDSYRTKLSGFYKKSGLPIEKENIIVTTGASEAILFALGSTTDYGDEVIVPEPFYANYSAFAIASDVKVVPVMSSIDTCFALPSVSDFEKKITSRTKAIILCNPGNPTGYLYSEREMEELAVIVKKYNLFLIVDEVYREFIYDGARHYSVMNMPEIAENAIFIDSVSKRYSMCGARIGCLVSKNKELIDTAMKFAQARLSPPTFGQVAAEAVLDTPESYITEVISEYKARRDTLIEGLRNIAGVKVSVPKGAFYCMVELPVDDTDKFARWLLESFNLNNETVMVAPARGFYSTPEFGKKEVRIAYVLKKEDLTRTTEILKKAIEVYNTM